jgi:chaperonin GroES
MKPDLDLELVLDRVLCLREDPEEASAGGIIIPDGAKLKTTAATIISVGPGRVREDGTRVAPMFNAGDRVLIDRYVGHDLELKVSGVPKKFTIITEDEVYARVREQKRPNKRQKKT